MIEDIFGGEPSLTDKFENAVKTALQKQEKDFQIEHADFLKNGGKIALLDQNHGPVLGYEFLKVGDVCYASFLKKAPADFRNRTPEDFFTINEFCALANNQSLKNKNEMSALDYNENVFGPLTQDELAAMHTVMTCINYESFFKAQAAKTLKKIKDAPRPALYP